MSTDNAGSASISEEASVSSSFESPSPAMNSEELPPSSPSRGSVLPEPTADSATLQPSSELYSYSSLSPCNVSLPSEPATGSEVVLPSPTSLEASTPLPPMSEVAPPLSLFSGLLTPPAGTESEVLPLLSPDSEMLLSSITVTNALPSPETSVEAPPPLSTRPESLPPPSRSSSTLAPSSATSESFTLPFDSGGLPSSSFDGSHLPWQTFRTQVLEPHRIQILETPSQAHLPKDLMAMIELASQDTGRYDDWRTSFRDQVEDGGGFGPTPLFPPDLLPSIDDDPQLARCTAPSFSREAMPERDLKFIGPFYELSVPRPALGCGFSAMTFTSEDTRVLPPFLVPTGTLPHLASAPPSAEIPIYCPYLLFERAYGTKKSRLRNTANLCAVDGAWCVRSLQILYSQAQMKKDSNSPTAFTCVIDSDIAVLNFHWVGSDQIYYMAPLCKFELNRDDHFNQFMVWIDSIGKWAILHLLPQIKDAFEQLRIHQPVVSTPPPTPGQAYKLKIDSPPPPSMAQIPPLTTVFSDVSWRSYDPEEMTGTSTTASWGSPLYTDKSLRNLNYPAVPTLQSLGGMIGGAPSPPVKKLSLQTDALLPPTQRILTSSPGTGGAEERWQWIEYVLSERIMWDDCELDLGTPNHDLTFKEPITICWRAGDLAIHSPIPSPC